MSKINVYKNNFTGKGHLFKSKQPNDRLNSGIVYCPYIPLMITPTIPTPNKWKRWQYKFQLWFYEICHKSYKSYYLMECLQDLYKQVGSKHLFVLDTHSRKKIDSNYYQKLM